MPADFMGLLLGQSLIFLAKGSECNAERSLNLLKVLPTLQMDYN